MVTYGHHDIDTHSKLLRFSSPKTVMVGLDNFVIDSLNNLLTNSGIAYNLEIPENAHLTTPMWRCSHENCQNGT